MEATNFRPKDPAIAAAVASLILTAQQMGVFDRMGVSEGDVLFWGNVAVIALTTARAIWIKFWPESAHKFLGGIKPAPALEPQPESAES